MIQEKIDHLRLNLGKYNYTTAEAINKKVNQILNQHPQACLFGRQAKRFVGITVRQPAYGGPAPGVVGGRGEKARKSVDAGAERRWDV